MREKSQSCLTAAIGLENFSSPSQPKYFTLQKSAETNLHKKQFNYLELIAAQTANIDLSLWENTEYHAI